MNDINQFIARKIKEFRQDRNLTQEELAKAIGVTQQQIERYENNKRRITFPIIIKISDFLDIPMSNFFPKVKTSLDDLRQHLTDYLIGKKDYSEIDLEIIKILFH